MGDYLSDHFDLLAGARAIFSTQQAPCRRLEPTGRRHTFRLELYLPTDTHPAPTEPTLHGSQLKTGGGVDSEPISVRMAENVIYGYWRMLHNSDETDTSNHKQFALDATGSPTQDKCTQMMGRSKS